MKKQVQIAVTMWKTCTTACSKIVMKKERRKITKVSMQPSRLSIRNRQ